MSERTEAELRRILASARAPLSEAVDRVRAQARPPAVELGDRPGPGAGAPGRDPAKDGAVGDLVATCVLWSQAWDPAALAELHALVDEADGARRLLAVEPVPALGLARLGQRVGRRWLHRRHGHHFERDLPRELRAVGFQVFAIDRFRTDRFGLATYALLVLGPRRDGRRAPTRSR